MATFERLADRLGVAASLVPSWDDLFLWVDGERLRAIDAIPTTVNMSRVVATQRAVEAIGEGRLDGVGARAAPADAARAPQATLTVFVLASAGALVTINGASHPWVVGVVALCAAAGALLRRGPGAALRQLVPADLRGLPVRWARGRGGGPPGH